MTDLVNQPPHYTKGRYDSIDVIEDVAQFYPPVEAFLIGQVIKYICRAPHKGSKQADLLKAQFYLNRLVGR